MQLPMHTARSCIGDQGYDEAINKVFRFNKQNTKQTRICKSSKPKNNGHLEKHIDNTTKIHYTNIHMTTQHQIMGILVIIENNATKLDLLSDYMPPGYALDLMNKYERMSLEDKLSQDKILDLIEANTPLDQ